MLKDQNGKWIIWRTCDKELVVIKDEKEDIVYRQVQDKGEAVGGEVSKEEKEKRCEG